VRACVRACVCACVCACVGGMNRALLYKCTYIYVRVCMYIRVSYTHIHIYRLLGTLYMYVHNLTFPQSDGIERSIRFLRQVAHRNEKCRTYEHVHTSVDNCTKRRDRAHHQSSPKSHGARHSGRWPSPSTFTQM